MNLAERTWQDGNTPIPLNRGSVIRAPRYIMGYSGAELSRARVKRHVNALAMPNHATNRVRLWEESKQGGIRAHSRVPAGPVGWSPKKIRLCQPGAVCAVSDP